MQHKQLIGIVNEFDQSFWRGAKREAMVEALDSLEEYIDYPFPDEERFMREIGYDRLDLQLRAHEGLKRQVTRLREEYEKGETTGISEMAALLSQWLLRHIMIDDKAIGKFADALHQ